MQLSLKLFDWLVVSRPQAAQLSFELPAVGDDIHFLLKVFEVRCSDTGPLHQASTYQDSLLIQHARVELSLFDQAILTLKAN